MTGENALKFMHTIRKYIGNYHVKDVDVFHILSDISLDWEICSINTYRVY